MKKLVLLATTAAMLPATAMAELNFEAYGSIRIQAETVKVDRVANVGDDKSYSDLKDAYSRFGVKASYQLSNGTTLGAKLEIPLNTAQLEVGDPSYFEGFYKSNKGPRVAKITASGDWGSAAVGKQWLTYYNHIGYPVDYFSSFYSGFATHATFRREAVTYNSPSFAGFAFSASAVDMNDDSDGKYLDTMQYALSYSKDGLSLAAALENRGKDAGDFSTMGLAAAYTTGPWRFATKVEQLENTTAGVDDQMIKNIYASYNMGNYTFKAHYAVGDEEANGGAFFTGTSTHLGVDYQYNKDLKVFIEYFTEENAYAIYSEDADGFDPLGGYGTNTDGQALAIGARYDF